MIYAEHRFRTRGLFLERDRLCRRLIELPCLLQPKLGSFLEPRCGVGYGGLNVV